MGHEHRRQNCGHFGHSGVIYSVSFRPMVLSLASGSWDNTIKLWEVSTGQELRTMREYATIFSVSFSPDGRFLASGSDDSTIKLWEVSTGQELQMLPGA
ncbi:MAG: hypothetical protein R2880_04775 [Deinococcales bacterium]